MTPLLKKVDIYEFMIIRIIHNENEIVGLGNSHLKKLWQHLETQNKIDIRKYNSYLVRCRWASITLSKFDNAIIRSKATFWKFHGSRYQRRVWWQLWNFLVYQLKFNRLSYPNEHFQRIFFIWNKIFLFKTVKI